MTRDQEAQGLMSTAQTEETYGKALKRALELADWSQNTLAAQAKVARNTVRNLIHDRTLPQQGSHERIANALRPILLRKHGEEVCAETLQALQAVFDNTQRSQREHEVATDHRVRQSRALNIGDSFRAAGRAMRSHARTMPLPFGVVGILFIAVLATVIVNVRPSLTAPPRESPTAAAVQGRVQGNLLGVVQLSAKSSGIGYIDAGSGAILRLLLAPEGQTQSYIAPTYAPARRLLAFIAIASDGVRNVEMTALRVTPDGPPQVVEPAPRVVAPNCGSRCNTLTWTPNGDQLIFEGMDGLIAVNPVTGEQRPVTQGAHDAWPACSPDGAWLAFQHDVETAGYTEAVPAVDCLPVRDAAAMAQIISGYIIAWHPTWSVDGAKIAFLTKSAKGTQVETVDASNLSRQGIGRVAQWAPTPVGASRCAEPVWAIRVQKPQTVLLILCPSVSGNQFMALSGAHLDIHQTLAAASSGPQPTIYNPVWIPPLKLQ